MKNKIYPNYLLLVLLCFFFANEILATNDPLGAFPLLSQTAPNKAPFVQTAEPDPTLTPDINYTPVDFQGTTVFITCGTSQKSITVTNASTTQSTNTSYKISWGDNSPDFTGASFVSTSHTYAKGDWDLTFTVTNGTVSKSKTYKVFVTANPAVTLMHPGNTDICITDPLTFPITQPANNPPGTVYSINFNDGSPVQTFDDLNPLPKSITHTFLKSSCGVTTEGYTNALSVDLVAENSCGSSTSSIRPIYVSTPPVADFTVPSSIYCANVPFCVSNTSKGASESAAGGCSTLPTLVWTITPNTYTLDKGYLGSTNNKDFYQDWTTGSAEICPVFTKAGKYTITLLTANRCGMDTIVKVIEIEDVPVPEFSIFGINESNEGCVPFTITTTNSSNTLKATTPSTYRWSVSYDDAYCGTEPGWSFANGTTESDESPSFEFAKSGIYTIKLTIDNTCGPFIFKRTIKAKKAPEVSINEIPNLCGPGAIEPTAIISSCSPSSAGLNYKWSFPGGTPSSSSKELPGSVVYTTEGTHTIMLEVTNECGKSTVVSTTFKVNVKPTVDQVGDQILCFGEYTKAIHFTSPNPNVKFVWTNSVSNIGLYLKNGEGDIPSFVGNTGAYLRNAKFKVFPKDTVTGCVGDSMMFAIKVYPIPTVDTIQNVILCKGEVSTVIPITSEIANTNFTWTNSNPAIGLAASGATNKIPAFTAINNGDIPIVSTIAVTPNRNSCSGEAMVFTITVNPTPTVNKPVNQELCSGVYTDPINFISPYSGTTYIWTNDNPTIGVPASGSGNIESFQAVNNNSTSVTITANFTVTSSINSCVGNTESFSIKINPAPNVNFSESNQTISSSTTSNKVDLTCNILGSTVSWIAIQPDGVTGVATSGTNEIPAQILINNTRAPIDVIYKAIATSADGFVCPGSEFKYKITVIPTPKVANPYYPNLCSGNTFEVTPVDGGGNILPPGTKFTWTEPVYSTNGTITGASAQSIPQNSISQTLTNTTDQIVKVTYNVTPKVGSYSGPVFQVIVTVNPIPKVQFSAKDTIICSGISTPVVNLSSPTVGSVSYQWVANIPTGIFGATLTTGTNTIPAQNFVNATYLPLEVVYSARATLNNGNSCSGPEYYYKVKVKPTPFLVDIPNVVMSDSEFFPEYLFDSNIPGTTFEWTNDEPSIGLAASGKGDLPGFIGSNLTLIPVTANITVTPILDGCAGTSRSFTIKVNPTPTVVTIQDQFICNGVKTNSVIFSGKLSTTKYYWTNDNPSIGLKSSGVGNIPSFIAVNNGSSPLVAHIVITPTANGTEGKKMSFTYSVNPTPIIVGQPESIRICQNDVADAWVVSYINGSGTPSYQWYSNYVNNTATGYSISGATSADFIPPTSQAGLMYYYCVISFNESGCSSLVSNIAEVIVNDKPAISDLNTTICNGGTFVVIPTNSNGNIVPYGTTYTWSAPTILPVGAIVDGSAEFQPRNEIRQTLTNITNEAAVATYTVVPKIGLCSGTPFKVDVTVNATIEANAVVTNSACAGARSGAINTNITGGALPYTILWAGPSGFNSNSENISNLVPGRYNLVISSPGGCTYSNSYNLTEPNEIILTLNDVKNVSCNGSANGKIDISVYGGDGNFKYKWLKDGIDFAITQDISDLEAGQYIVEVTDGNSCTPKTDTIMITQPDILKVTYSKVDVVCHGDSAGSILISPIGGTKFKLPSGFLDYRYQWSGINGFSSTKKNLNKLPVGTYQLTITDSLGCNTSISVDIAEPAEFKVNAEIQQISCHGANDGAIKVSAQGGAEPYQIVWNNFASGWQQENLSGGNYSLTVTDANGCEKSVDILIIDPAEITMNPIVKNISCNGANDGSIDLNMGLAVKDVSFSWSDGSVAGSVRNNLSPGTYSVSVNEGLPCSISRTFEILEPNKLSVIASIKDALDCNNANSGSINLVVSGGTKPYNFVWSNGTETEDLDAVSAGDYAVVITDAGGCSTSARYSVKRQSAINIEVITTLAYNCSTKKIGATSLASISGGVPPYDLKWSNGTPNLFNQYEMTTDNGGLIMLEVTDNLGCTESYTFNIDIPETSFTTKRLDCLTQLYGFELQIPNILGNVSYLWDFGDGKTSTARSPEHLYDYVGNYFVVLNLITPNCNISLQKMIVVEDVKPLRLLNTPKFCEGDSVLVKVEGAKTYHWDNGSTSESVWIKEPGMYRVTGVTGDGCITEVNFEASYYPTDEFKITTDKNDISPENSIVLFKTDDVPLSQYTWDFGDGVVGYGNNISHHYDIDSKSFYDVRLKVENPYGCSKSDAKKIWVINTFIPNTFTPNNDGVDDVFMKDWHIKIYNRNGILLYDGNDGWDGTYNGKPVSNDTYFCVLHYLTQDGVKTNTGYITLIR